MRRKWKKMIWIVVIVYILGGVLLYFLQDRILFHPVTLKKEDKFDFTQKHNDINIPVDEENNLNIVQFLTNDSISKGVVLYFHGNKKNISAYARHTDQFTKHGYEVWMIDYPGFGKSTGKLTEQSLYDGATQLYEFARSRFATDSIIIYGRSMGTGIAAELASRRNCSRLVLETPYYDFPSVVKHYLPIYPVKMLIHYQVPTHEYLPKVLAPVTIFHGTKDRVIPYKNAKRLEKLLKNNDEFITIRGGHHNDLLEYDLVKTKIDSLLTH